MSAEAAFGGRSILSASPEAAERREHADAGTDHATPRSARVEARGLGKAYGSRIALEGVSFDLRPATIVAVVGANGAGKSTLIGCLAGTIRHDGEVSFDGAPLATAPRGRIAYLPQRLRLPASATVAEVMRLFRALAGTSDDRVPAPAGLVPDEGRLLGRLSGGEAQRVGLVAALQGSPDLILLDEPLANLDDIARGTVSGLLRAHRDAGATILITSPTSVDVLALVDEVMAIDGGRMVDHGPAAGVLGRAGFSIWVRGADDAEVDALGRVPGVVGSRVEEAGGASASGGGTTSGDGTASSPSGAGRPGERWLVLQCRGEDGAAVIRSLAALGVDDDRIRIGGPARGFAAPRGPEPAASDRPTPGEPAP